MLESLNADKTQLLTLKQFAEKNPWPNVSTLRTMYSNRKSNGLDKAFIRSGRRIIVDEEVLFDLIRKNK